MLIEFSVANFRSIKEKQTLSMVTASKDADGRCMIETGFKAAPCLVESAAIYGPNGSGKSNLVNAMDFVWKLVVYPPKPDKEIEAVPFLFSEETQNEPSEFEIVFIHNGFLYQYGFVVDDGKVHEEWLYATPKDSEKQKQQTWLERNGDKIDVPRREIKGDKEVWKRSTRHNELFLSKAVDLNSEDFKAPFDWIRKNFKTPSNHSDGHSTQLFSYLVEKKEAVLRFMKSLDASFEDIRFDEKDFSDDFLSLIEMLPDEAGELRKAFSILHKAIPKKAKDQKLAQVYTIHSAENGDATFLSMEEESAGTRKLFSFSPALLDVLDNGYTLVVDELDNSLHPHAMRGVIAMFSNKKINKKNAQLIFTTHDTNAMNFMARDQIWLMDKGTFGDTKLNAISDFKGRADDAIEKRYLSGRYGALPNIKDML